MRGSGWATASSASGTARSGSYSTMIKSRAAVATSSLIAATAATGSPTKRTLSGASACSSWLTGRMPKGMGRSFPVSTAFPPASRSALVVSILTIFACGCGLRSSLAYSIRGKNKSSAKIVAPVTFAVASIFRRALPMTVWRLAPAIQRLRRRLGLLPAHAGGGQLHRLVDLEVTGAAAEVAGQRLLDRVAGGARVGHEQGVGGEEEGRRAVTALRGAELGERILERVQPAVRREPFDGGDAPPGAGEAEDEAGEHGRAVDEHGAGPALAQLAAVLRARESRVFAQYFEECFVGREGDGRRLTIQLETDCGFRVGHSAKRNLVPRAARWHLNPMRKAIRLIALVLAAGSAGRLTAQAAKPDSFRIRALAILRTVPLIDGHNDIPDAIRERGGFDSGDFSASQPKLMTDIPRMRAGGMGGQFWAAYVPVGTIHGEGPHPAVYALEQIDLVRRLCRRYPQALAMAATAADVERNFRAGKISCLIGIEGGHAIENSLGALRMFYTLGVRYMTLTHWETIDWADAATDSAKHGGLTPFGEDVVREMNRLGMLVDLSHVSDSTMIDALRVSRAPVIFSHSSARALDSHVRNVPDSILRLLARNGGVVMTNFAPDYVAGALRAYGDTLSHGIARLRAAGLRPAPLPPSV